MMVFPVAMIALALPGCIPPQDPPAVGYPRSASSPHQAQRQQPVEQDFPREQQDESYRQAPVRHPPSARRPSTRTTRQPQPRRYVPRDDQRPYEPQGGYRSEQQGRPSAEDRTGTPALAAWQARPVAPSAEQVDPSTYVVRPGDTLGVIGDRTGAGSEAIARANSLAAPFIVRTGQRLSIPGGRYHRVAAGQTGIAISRAYGVDWSRIIAANDLREPYTLRVGMRVLIPGTSSRSTAAERAAAFTLDIDDLVTGSEPALAANQRPARPSTSSARILAPTQALAPPARLTSGFDWPVHGRIVTRFGPGASGERYNGVKIAVPRGTPVLAAADGVVAYAGGGIPQLGDVIIIRHGDGWATVYGHASKLLVQRGQAVRRGQTIAMSGDSGGAPRPEVHFEMRKGRTPIDPQRQLPAI
jgi:lipoprotein NlpD